MSAMARTAFKPANLRADLMAGLTTALVTIPDGLASAILAGVSPINGLYGLMTGTPIAALLSSSQFMYVSNTGALSVAVGSALIGFSSADKQTALVTLTVLAGAIALLMGLLKLGGILRFVSNAVLTGFMAGIALNIILGQLNDLTGFPGVSSNKVVNAVGLLFNLNAISIPTTLVGIATIGLILLLGRTRLSQFNMILAIIAASLVVNVLGLPVQEIGDIATIPPGFPVPALPDFSLIPQLLLPALSIAIIGLVQAAGVSKSTLNADGSYPDASRDFTAQGAANLASGVFGGLPLGGTMSETSVNVKSGAKTRFAILYSGLIIIVLVLIFAPLIEMVAMPAVAALLIVAGYEAIKFHSIREVYHTGWLPRIIMIVTFIATLFLAIQEAVLLGVVLSMAIYIYRSSLDIRLAAFRLLDDGRMMEEPVPAELPSNSVTVLTMYGSPFFAAAATVEKLLPRADKAQHAVVILNLRGRDAIGSTFIELLERYDAALEKGGGKLMLSGLDPFVLGQIARRETHNVLPEPDLFTAGPILGESTRKAVAAAHAWLEQDGEQPMM